MAAGCNVIAYGVRIGLDAEGEGELGDLTLVLPPGARTTRRSARDVSYALRRTLGTGELDAGENSVSLVDGKVLERSGDYNAAIQSIDRHIQLYVAEHAPRRLFIHAGVVGWHGQAIVIPGRTHYGKSTLVSAFLRAGARYYSDEFAVVDTLGRIHPYPKPIGVRDQSGRSNEVDPAELSAKVGRKPLTARLILVTRYRRGARWRPRRISWGEGMLALLANTVPARRDPARALRTLNRMSAGAIALSGPRGEAEAVVEQMVSDGQLPGAV